MKKICSKCNILKDLNEYYKAKTGKDGLRSDCKECYKQDHKTRREANPNYMKDYYKVNLEQIKKANKKYYLENKEIKKAKQREYTCKNKEEIARKNKERYLLNCETIKLKAKQYRDNNKSKIRALNAKHRADKKQATPQWFNKEEVKYIYEIAKEKNLEVDHMVPLNSRFVCGLHVQDNLRCISKELNRMKRNIYWPDMWDYSIAL